MSAAKDTLLDSATDAVDQVQRAAGSAIKRGKRQAGRLFDQGGELIDEVSAKATKARKSVIAYTQEKPLIALLIAAAAGAIVMSAAKSLQSRRYY
jgi:hypothetical protein